MDKLLKPDLLLLSKDLTDLETQWRHWKTRLNAFLSCIPDLREEHKMPLLTNLISADMFRYIESTEIFAYAILALEALFVKPRNVVFQRHVLSTYKQAYSQTIDQFLHELLHLAKSCDFEDVNAKLYNDEYVCDSFIRGLASSSIRQRLLERSKLSLDDAYQAAESLKQAELQANSYSCQPVQMMDPINVAASSENMTDDYPAIQVNATRQSCLFCENAKHPQAQCPALKVKCRSCQKVGYACPVGYA